MQEKPVRVRFAPSPTGGLHLGGVRTVLYNYLFAKKHGGQFILRIEDTDQSRFVEGAEQYIYDCLAWCGLQPDESPAQGGPYGPYRQSERKALYKKYAEQLIASGHAYYAFDTPEELESMRQQHKTDHNPTPAYDQRTRPFMKNSLTLPETMTKQYLNEGHPHVIRIKMPENEIIRFDDLIHGEVQFDSGLVDDKVLLKADGMPTYHLAVVVDDYLMKISHAFRGEEWLSSAPVHIQLWKTLFGLDQMPQWAHLPLILGPQGKLSKRDGAKYGFPVYAMNWTDPRNGEFTEGFKEKGFLPEAFLNLLAMLGWNDGTEQEIYSLEEMAKAFSLDRVHKAGARFDYEKARWFNHEWIRRKPAEEIHASLISFNPERYSHIPAPFLIKAIDLVKERCALLADFDEQLGFFIEKPLHPDWEAVKPKWTDEKRHFFTQWQDQLAELPNWDAPALEAHFKEKAAAMNIKPGELQLPLRIMLVGGKFGPAVFDIAALLGKQETLERIGYALTVL